LLTDRGLEVVPFFYNPNVHPFREYRERYFAVVDYCAERGLDLKAGPYEMERFLAEVAPLEDAGDTSKPPARCARCFSIRLDRTAAEARALGIDSFSTTLLVSPYQDQELLRDAGESAAAEHGASFIFEDMSGGFREASERARDSGIYRQSW